MANSDQGIQLRKYPRRAFSHAIGVLAAGFYILADGFEIGEGGLSFCSEDKIEIGTIIVLTFQIPGGIFISTTSEVRSVAVNDKALYIHGCIFKNIKFEYKRKIRTYVSARAP